MTAGTLASQRTIALCSEYLGNKLKSVDFRICVYGCLN